MRKWIIPFLLFSFLSCNESAETIPDQRMVDILTDMLIVDELLVKYGSKGEEPYRDSLKMMILDRYDFAAFEFDSIMTEVQKDLKGYHVLQSKVAEKLDSLKNVVESKSQKDNFNK